MNDTENGLVNGRYRLIESIGWGSMGLVWRGRDEVFGRDVEIEQVLLPEGASDEVRAELREMARSEARAAASLRHPDDITILDVIDHGGAPMIVREVAKRRSVADHVRAYVSAVSERDIPRRPGRGSKIAAAAVAAAGIAFYIAAGVVWGSPGVESPAGHVDVQAPAYSGARTPANPPASLSFSPDGKHVAAARDDGGGGEASVQIWDATWHASVATILSTTLPGPVAFSPDGKRVAVGGAGNTNQGPDFTHGRVEVDDVAGGTIEVSFDPDQPVTRLAFARDGRSLITASATGRFEIWDLTDGKRVGDPVSIPGCGSVAISPDGTAVACATGKVKPVVEVWDLRARELRTTLQLPERWNSAVLGKIVNLSFSADGTMVAAGTDRGTGGDGTIFVWTRAANRLKAMASAATGKQVDGLAFSPDGKVLATLSGSTLAIWDARTLRQTGVTVQVDDPTGAITFSRDGTSVACASTTKVIRSWDVKTGAETGMEFSWGSPS